MAVTNVALWVSASRWERPGSELQLRARVKPLPVVGRGGDLVQVIPLAYPVLVVLAPAWTYQGWLNWSTGIDLPLQVAGLALWAAGVAVGFSAARAIGAYGGISGVTVNHRLVSDGPYRYVRHPIYTAIITISVGTTLVFRSYLLLAVAGVSIAAHLWWAAAEENLLGSTDGLADDYRVYAARTGRFLPRVKRR